MLKELQRTGAFDRKAIVIGSTTGTGSLDPNAMDPIDYMFNGDDAIAGVQYSYLPSWISLFADPTITKETRRPCSTTIHDYWVTLPEASTAAAVSVWSLAWLIWRRVGTHGR